jgi:hypothetical protein
LDNALQKLARVFALAPGFWLIDDSEAPNALALPPEAAASAKLYTPGTPGTVLLGRTLFSNALTLDASGIAVIQICAHEFGHIAQFNSRSYLKILDDQPTVKRVELDADYLSGYYLGVLKKVHPEASFFNTGVQVFQSGDTLYTNPTHHGTPDERIAAAETGFRLSCCEKMVSFQTAFDEGVRYVANK